MAYLIEKNNKIFCVEGEYEWEYIPPENIDINLEQKSLNKKIDDLTLLLLQSMGVIE